MLVAYWFLASTKWALLKWMYTYDEIWRKNEEIWRNMNEIWRNNVEIVRTLDTIPISVSSIYITPWQTHHNWRPDKSFTNLHRHLHNLWRNSGNSIGTLLLTDPSFITLNDYKYTTWLLFQLTSCFPQHPSQLLHHLGCPLWFERQLFSWPAIESIEHEIVVFTDFIVQAANQAMFPSLKRLSNPLLYKL